jgi:hypothetical protein
MVLLPTNVLDGFTHPDLATRVIRAATRAIFGCVGYQPPPMKKNRL